LGLRGATLDRQHPSALTNDLGSRWSLIAVSASSNRSKGDSDPSEWLPPNHTYRCTYAKAWVATKWRWHLSINPTEKASLTMLVRHCGAMTVHVTRAPIAIHRGGTGGAGGGGSGGSPHNFANCDAMHVRFPHGVGLPHAHDHTSGTPVTNFFHSKPWYLANKSHDGDGDGIACEA
jgi:hypothetical protein